MPNPLINQAVERFKNKYCSFELVEVVKKRDQDRLETFLRTELEALEKAVREEYEAKLSVTDRVKLLMAQVEILKLKAVNGGYDWSMVDKKTAEKLNEMLVEIESLTPTKEGE